MNDNNHGAIRTKFENDGGMIVHLDATDEKGGNAVFQIKEEKTGFLLYSDNLISERSEYITPILRDFESLYGTPKAIVRDMGSAIINSCNEVFPDTPNQICHFHFIRALGKRIFEDIHSNLRKEILRSKIKNDLFYVRKATRVKLPESSVMCNERHALFWLHLLLDHVQHPLNIPSDFPFRLAYKEYYDRIMDCYQLLSDDEAANGGAVVLVRQLSNFKETISSLIKNKKISRIIDEINALWGWFEELRKAMRLMRNELRESRKLTHIDITKMKEDLKQLIKSFLIEGEMRKGIFLRKSKMISESFEKRWNGLFVELENEKGELEPVRQDNNIDEQAHRWIRMGIRRRTGRSRTQKEMYQLGPLLAYFSNMFNDEYRKLIGVDLNNFTTTFSKLDWNILSRERRKLFFYNDGVSIPVRDKKRKKLINEYVDNVIEGRCYSDEYLPEWLSKMDNLIESWNFDFIDVDANLEQLYPTEF
jgi:hypothetical protein